MPDKHTKQYNLCSNMHDKVHMPVHIQLCEDREFFYKNAW